MPPRIPQSWLSNLLIGVRHTVFFFLLNFYIDLAGFLGFPLFLDRHRSVLIFLHLASVMLLVLHSFGQVGLQAAISALLSPILIIFLTCLKDDLAARKDGKRALEDKSGDARQLQQQLQELQQDEQQLSALLSALLDIVARYLATLARDGQRLQRMKSTFRERSRRTAFLLRNLF